jgi:hypothetical protein
MFANKTLPMMTEVAHFLRLFQRSINDFMAHKQARKLSF